MIQAALCPYTFHVAGDRMEAVTRILKHPTLTQNQYEGDKACGIHRWTISTQHSLLARLEVNEIFLREEIYVTKMSEVLKDHVYAVLYNMCVWMCTCVFKPKLTLLIFLLILSYAINRNNFI